MNYDKIQWVLNKLYTNKTYLSNFLDGPEKFLLQEEQLGAAEQAFLLSMNREEIKINAAALAAKRWHAVKGLLPFSTFLLKKEAREKFQEFTDTYLPEGIHKHQLDAICFAKFMQDKSVSRLIKEVIQVEAMQVQNFITPSPLRQNKTKGLAFGFIPVIQPLTIKINVYTQGPLTKKRQFHQDMPIDHQKKLLELHIWIRGKLICIPLF